MKKFIISLATVAMMSTSAMAIDGPIDFVKLQADGTIEVKIAGNKKSLVGTPEAIQAMYATILTAQASGDNISAWGGDYNSASGWATIQYTKAP